MRLSNNIGIYEQNQNDWHNSVDLAVFVHNTSYHASIECTPTFLFHGRQPITKLRLRYNETIQNLETCCTFTRVLQDKRNEVLSAARDATSSSYNKYCHYYDRKASALPFKKHQYCLLLSPQLTTVIDPIGKSLSKWLPLYRVETVLTNSNYIYIIRKVGTNNTQCVHRIRLRPIQLQYEVTDLPVIHSTNFIPNPITSHYSEPTLCDNALPDLLTDRTFSHLRYYFLMPPVVYDPHPHRSYRHHDLHPLYIVNFRFLKLKEILLISFE